MGRKISDRQLTTRGAEIGVPQGGHFGCSKCAKIGGIFNGISPRQLGYPICRSICDPLKVKRGLTYTLHPKISMTLGVVTIQTGSTTAEMAKSAVTGDPAG